MSIDLALVDRDGVILQHVDPYILHSQDVRLIPGAVEALRIIAGQGTRIAVVTNQSPVGRGLITAAFVDEVNALIRREVGSGVTMAFFFCPHLPTDGCECRKPRPGLINQACEHFGIPVTSGALVGDHATDVQAGVAAGVARCARVRSGRFSTTPPQAFAEYKDLLETVRHGFFVADGHCQLKELP